MFKGAQDKQDYIARTASHATKGHGSKGASLDAFKFQEQVRSDRLLTLEEKKQRRADLITLKGTISHGKARADLDNRISALNTAIKAENTTIANNYAVGLFYVAMKQVLPPDLVEKVSERVRQLRIENEQA